MINEQNTYCRVYRGDLHRPVCEHDVTYTYHLLVLLSRMSDNYR